MQHTIHDNGVPLHLKQDAIIANAEPVFRCEVGEFLDITGEVMLQHFNLRDDTAMLGRRQGFEILEGTWLFPSLFDVVERPPGVKRWVNFYSPLDFVVGRCPIEAASTNIKCWCTHAALRYLRSRPFSQVMPIEFRRARAKPSIEELRRKSTRPFGIACLSRSLGTGQKS